MQTILKTVVVLAGALLSTAALAQSAGGGLEALTSQPTGSGGTEWSVSIQTLVLFTLLAFLPAVVLLMTGFTRIVIVLSLLRSALGTPTAPPNQVLIGLSLFLTLFVMSPVFEKVYDVAYEPLSNDEITFQQALSEGAGPMRDFMLAQTRKTDIGMFADISGTGPIQTPDDTPMRILLPAFVTSELKTAFQIGFTIFIPFLVIDLVVASVLMSLGMMMVPPATISLPFKLMLFVLVDGWSLLIGSLAKSFN